MKKFKKHLKRVAAVALSVLMLANTVELPVFTVHAEETTYGTTIDGTLGGKTTAEESDITALVDAIKGYVDSGITTITVTGSNPAIIDMGTYKNTAIGEAIYRLSKEASYNGKIDLILPDVTEIVDYEFQHAYALNSINLPKVTTIGVEGIEHCSYLQKLTFGSVVTSIKDGIETTFTDVGTSVDGGRCDLVLSCGQAIAPTESEYQPNLSQWWNTYWKSITLAHSGGEATCTTQAVCAVCAANYGEVDPDNHTGTLSTYAPTADGSQHAATWSCCKKVETADHTAEPTYSVNKDDRTKHDVTYSCCGTFTEVHSGGSYSVSGAVITDSCTKCGTELGTATISATGKTYGGAAVEATVNGTGTLADKEWTIYYEVKEGETLEAAPAIAGTYTASITLGEGENAVTATVEFEIKKADLDLGTVTAETLENTLDRSTVKLSPANKTVDGTLALAADTVLKYGTNIYDWVFTPKDTTNYNQATGTVEITINDTIAPVISGVTDGGSYCEAQTITVTDANTLTVTINDSPVELTNGTYELAATGERYVIVATDGMNNSTTVTVTVGHVDADSDGKCDNCGSFADGIGAVDSNSLSLNGDISVNFYMKLDESVVNDNAAVLRFTVNGTSNDIPVSSISPENDGTYKFSTDVAAAQMADEITVKVITSDGEGDTFTYSVTEYAKAVFADPKYANTTAPLMKAMLNYGTYAQNYFNYNTGSPANAVMENAGDKEVSVISADVLSPYAHVITGTLPEGITYTGSTLLLESEVTIRHYFTVAEGKTLPAVNAGWSDWTQKGSEYYTEMTGIVAAELDEMKQLTLESWSIEYSALSYAKLILEKDSSAVRTGAHELMSALYYYNMAANTYFDN